MTRAYLNDGSANMFSFEEIIWYECQYFKRFISPIKENKSEIIKFLFKCTMQHWLQARKRLARAAWFSAVLRLVFARSKSLLSNVTLYNGTREFSISWPLARPGTGFNGHINLVTRLAFFTFHKMINIQFWLLWIEYRILKSLNIDPLLVKITLNWWFALFLLLHFVILSQYQSPYQRSLVSGNIDILY